MASRRKTLQSEITAAHDRLKAIMALAESEGRAQLSEDEDKEYATYEATIASLNKELEREDRLLAMEKGLGRKAEPDTGTERSVDPTPKFASFGEQLRAIYNASRPGGFIDPRLSKQASTGMNESVGSEGGFLVQTDYEQGVLQKAREMSKVWPLANSVTVSAGANGLKINLINETDRATGSRWGGVRGYWLEEGGTKTKSAPKFRVIELKLKKLIGLGYATDELLEDAQALGTVLENGFASEFAFMLDDAVINGTGAGMPLGILNAGCTVSQSKETGQAAATIVAENLYNMYSRLWAGGVGKAVWFINQSAWPQLFKLSQTVGVGGMPMFMSSITGAPANSLLGLPIIPIEQCAALGTVGDIILADMSQYLTINKGGVQSASSIHVQFTTDETTFRWVYRADGMPTWNAALTPYKDTAKTQSPFVTLATRA